MDNIDKVFESMETLEQYLERKLGNGTPLECLEAAYDILLQSEIRVNCNPVASHFLQSARNYLSRQMQEIFLQEFYPPDHIYNIQRP